MLVVGTVNVLVIGTVIVLVAGTVTVLVCVTNVVCVTALVVLTVCVTVLVVCPLVLTTKMELMIRRRTAILGTMGSTLRTTFVTYPPFHPRVHTIMRL